MWYRYLVGLAIPHESAGSVKSEGIGTGSLLSNSVFLMFVQKFDFKRKREWCTVPVTIFFNWLC